MRKEGGALMDKKRWSRRILVKILVAVATMVVVLIWVSTARNKMQEYTRDSDVGGPFPVYEGETLDIKVVKPNDITKSPEATAADVVYYLDGVYTRYLGADILGGSHVGEPIGTLMEPGGENGKHKVGTAVYQWQGYDPWYRIAICSAEGGNYYYERWTEEALAQLSLEEMLPADDLVTSMSIYMPKGAHVGQITDPQVISTLLAQLRESGGFHSSGEEKVIKSYEMPAMTDLAGRRLVLTLVDGSSLTITVYDGTEAYCLREISLPGGWLETVCGYEIYTVDESLGSTNYGSPLVGEWARPTERKIEQWVNGNEMYSIGTLWVDDHRLCMGYSGCFGPQASREWGVLAEDVTGDLRVEDMEIWYRTTEGAVAYLYFWYPHGHGALYDELEKGNDLSKYVKERTILYEGPFVKLQVRDGVVWTLDEDGMLRRQDQVIAADVNCFVLDASGVIYGTKSGLYRLQESAGEKEEDQNTARITEEAKQLATDHITAVTSAELLVYYATDQGQVRCVRVDGLEDRMVCEAEAKALQFCREGADRYLLMTDERDILWSIRSGGQLVKVAEGVEAAQLVDYSLWVRYKESKGEAAETSWTAAETTGLTNVKRIALRSLLSEAELNPQ